MQIKRLHFDSIDSTNTWAKAHASELDQKALTIITADEQTAGRGRFTRTWVSPKACNLYATYVLFVSKIDEATLHIPQLLALIASETAALFVKGVALKWPNDLVIGKKKLGGILCEVLEVEGSLALITGIGLNINMSKEDLAKIDRPATSLKEALGEAIDKEKLIDILNADFIKALQKFQKEQFKPFLERFRNALIHKLGDSLKFHDFQKIIHGSFERVNDDGSLTMRLEDGSFKRFVSGELV